MAADFHLRASVRGLRVSLLVLVLACSTPEPEEGYYGLRLLNGVPVPYVDSLGCCTYSGGFLRLANAGYDLRIYFQNRQNFLVDTAFETGSYRVRGDSLVFDPRSANYPLSLYGAVRHRDTIHLRLGGDGPGAPDQFEARFWR
jgi:hypothetical protein